MKNLFTLPLEEGKGSSFEKYIVKNISKETENEINEMNVRINEFQKQYKRIFSKISSILLLISTFCFIVGIFSIKSNITYAILGFVGFVLSLGLSFLCIFLEYRQSKKIQTSEEYLKLNNDAEEIIKKAYKELGVEKNNNGVDVYLYYYIEKNGKITSGLPYKSLMVKEYVLYKDEEYFYLGDVYNVVRLPLSSIRGFSKHANQFSFYGWSKKDLPNSPKYKEYKIKSLNNMYFKIKGFYSLDLEIEGENISIYVASYDKEIVENVLNLDK